MTHAYLPPSGAGAWVHCPLWPTMNQRYPQDDADESAEGTAAHWVNIQPEPPALGSRAPNGIAVTAEMLEGRALWLQATAGVLPGLDEQELHDEPGTYRGGTPDRYAYSAPLLVVYDYKFGHGQVEVFENYQLIEYTRLILKRHGLSDLQTMVRLVVVQPRGYHAQGPVRVWEVGQAAMLRAYWNLLDAGAAKALQPNPPGIVGEHCRYCPGRHACDALQRNTWQRIEQAGASLPLELDARGVGYELREVRRALKLLQARETGLDAQATALLMRGERVPYFHMGSTKPRQVWKISPEQLAGLGRAFNVTLTKLEPITPTQAIAAGMPADVVAPFVDQPRGELKLIEDDGSFTRKAFGAK